ncbi:hypothetical protein ACIGO6_01670 [Streptomyces sp. NPDC053750]|uniref:hypothetical protein n=1 Tax=Streptomyces sp. NPDC053750 TaxID=3365714 RepID=UPI0037D06BCC
MPALPARRLALGACCAALLVGITGPAAMAADPARERTPAASSDTLLVQVRSLHADEGELAPVADLLEAVLAADGGRLSPAEATKLGAAAKEALQKAAEKARKDTATPAAPASAATTTPAAPNPDDDDTPLTDDDADDATDDTTDDTTDDADDATDDTTDDAADADADADDTVDDETELSNDLLDTVSDAVDDLMELVGSDDDAATTTQAPSSVDSLLAEVNDLLALLTGTAAAPQASTQPAPADPQASTLPAPAEAAPASQLPLLSGLKLPLLSSLLPGS